MRVWLRWIADSEALRLLARKEALRHLHETCLQSRLADLSSLYMNDTLHFACGLMCVPGDEMSKRAGLAEQNRDRIQKVHLVC
jgi:hypothetical protein